MIMDSGTRGRGITSVTSRPTTTRAACSRPSRWASCWAAGAVSSSSATWKARHRRRDASTGFLETLSRRTFRAISILVQGPVRRARQPRRPTSWPKTSSAGFPDVEGIFCPNESSTFGTLRALQESRLAGKVKFVGFDSSPKLVQALRDGHIHGLVLQNPVKMGYLGVVQVVRHLRGEKVPDRVDTGVTVATKDNMDTPEIKALLSPDLSILD